MSAAIGAMFAGFSGLPRVAHSKTGRAGSAYINESASQNSLPASTARIASTRHDEIALLALFDGRHCHVPEHPAQPDEG